MKYYTIESYSEKEAPFQIAWRVKLFTGTPLGSALLKEYEHIFYNEIAGYCKCLEDIGFIAGNSINLSDKDVKELEEIIKACNSFKNNEHNSDSLFNEEPEEYLWAKGSLY